MFSDLNVGVRCRWWCGWSGCSYDAIPNGDGENGLCCPMCGRRVKLDHFDLSGRVWWTVAWLTNWVKANE